METLREQALGALTEDYQDYTVPDCQNDFPKAAPGWIWVYNGSVHRHEVWCKGRAPHQGTLEQMADKTWQLWEKGSNLTREEYETLKAAAEKDRHFVSADWLKEGLQASNEMAWSVEQILKYLPQNHDEIPVILEDLREALLELGKGFAQKLKGDECH